VTQGPHSHRCKECREKMEPPCVDPTCAEGFVWVVLCLTCYERMVDLVELELAW
jgi:hypothetical protein